MDTPRAWALAAKAMTDAVSILVPPLVAWCQGHCQAGFGANIRPSIAKLYIFWLGITTIVTFGSNS